jgi:hypothetical protein
MVIKNENSSFCRSCADNKAEIKVMCPLIGAMCGFGCVSLSHCVHCSNHKGIDLETYKVDCEQKNKNQVTFVKKD